MQVGKTPDFRVVRGGELVAYCEVKSPNDPWLDEKLEEVPAFTIVGGARSDPTFNRLANEEDIGRRDRTCALLSRRSSQDSTRMKPSVAVILVAPSRH